MNIKNISILKSVPIIAVLLLSSAFIACNSDPTYSQLQDQEEVVIKNFIKNFDIKVVEEKPEMDNWPEKTYYKTPSGLYIHIVKTGDKNDTLRNNLTVAYRFKEHELDDDLTIRVQNWEARDFHNPSSMIYGTNMAINTYGAGLHEALGIMKNLGSEAYAIVPSNLNVEAYSLGRDRLIPVMYHLKITAIK